MKKLLFLLFTIHCSLFTAKADEGMWTLYNLPNAVYETMKMENYELPYGALLMASYLRITIAVLRPSAVTPLWSTTICSMALSPTPTKKNCQTKTSS